MHHPTPTAPAGIAFADLAAAPLPDDAEALRGTRRKAAKLIPEVAAVHSMRRCANFSHCSAPQCPLDPRWAVRVALVSEPTCTWFLEMAKDGPGTQYVPEAIREEVAHALATMLTSHGNAPLRVAVRRASTSGSRRRNAARLLQVEAEESVTVH
jgi:hypothetical protein